CTEVCDALFADITNGLPTAELLEEETDGVNGYSEEAPQPERPRVTGAQARERAPQRVRSEVVHTEPSPAAHAPEATPSSAAAPSVPSPDQTAAAGEAITEATWREIEQRLHGLGVEEGNRVRVASQIAGNAMKDCTEAEGRKVADTLEGLDAAGLDGLLAD